MRTIATVVTVSALVSLAGGAVEQTPSAAVRAVRLPAGALQPQVAVDDRGGLHVIYLQGDPARSDVFYAPVTSAGQLGSPIRVNRRSAMAIATGRVRGAHVAIGRDGVVHVAWLGSDVAKAAFGGRTPVLYARKERAAAAFEVERDVLQATINPDGSAIAAGVDGRVRVLWHGALPGVTDEAGRRVWMAESVDDGQRFAPERAISPAETGACGCCGLAALASRTGDMFAIYRGAREMVHRDALLLTSHDQARTFTAAPLQEWNVGACPMSTFSLAATAGDVVAAWETAGEVAWARIDVTTGRRGAVISPGPSTNRKYPVAVSNSRRDTLFAWVEDTGWSKGGALVWQRYDAQGVALGAPGRVPGLPVWGTVAAAALADDTFVLVY